MPSVMLTDLAFSRAEGDRAGAADGGGRIGDVAVYRGADLQHGRERAGGDRHESKPRAALEM
jgi:hypothetical protein